MYLTIFLVDSLAHNRQAFLRIEKAPVLTDAFTEQKTIANRPAFMTIGNVDI